MPMFKRPSDFKEFFHLLHTHRTNYRPVGGCAAFEKTISDHQSSCAIRDFAKVWLFRSQDRVYELNECIAFLLNQLLRLGHDQNAAGEGTIVVKREDRFPV